MIMQKIVAVAFVLLLLPGCSPAEGYGSSVRPEVKIDASSQWEREENDAVHMYGQMVLSETETTVTVRDAQGEKIIAKFPQRVVCLYNSLLDLWYLNGGAAVARVSGDARLPEAAAMLPEVGSMTAPSLEEIIAFEPDLVLLTITLDGQLEIAKSLEENGIPYLMCDMREDAFGSFGRYSYLFSRILGTEELFEGTIQPVIESCLALSEKTRGFSNQPTVAVLYSAPKYVKIETALSQTGQMVEMLGARNIVAQQEAPSDGSVRMDLSFETLLARDPEVILIVVMGDEEKCEAVFRQSLSSNPAWEELSAVKNGQLYVLPKEYSLYKPNAAYGEAFLYIARLLYPDADLTLES